jgi:hypothetical protein
VKIQNNFMLEAAVENWRAELAAQSDLTAEVRRELETHLRDAIAGFQQRGLNDEESFWLACKRVGQPPQLGEEFVKVDPDKAWRGRVFCTALVLFTFQVWNFACHLLLMLLLLVTNHYFPTWFEGLNGSISYTLTYLLPIVAFAIFLVRSGVKHLIRSFQFFFPSRSSFILVSLTLVLAIHTHPYFYGIHRGSWWILTGRIDVGQYILDSRNWFSQFWTNFLMTENVALTLVALITWLMPTRNRKIPKCA